MGRTPCCDKKGLKKGPWTTEEDEILVDYINKNGGHGSWRSLPKLAGLLRCGKSCRLRWTNYLRPDIKRGPFTPEEEKLVIQLHAILGNRWAAIASQLAGRTDNEIKNLWNTHLKKRLLCMGLDPQTHKPLTTSFSSPPSSSSPNVDVAASSLSTRHMAQWESARLEAEARLSKDSSLLFHSSLPPPNHATCPSKRCRDNDNDRDFFLRLWNSDVGDAFRNVIVRKLGDNDGGDAATCNDSISAVKTEVVDALQGDDNSTTSVISNVDDLEDSSDTALQLLLDFPICNNDMSFLEGTSFLYKTMLY